jgi:bifunctional DNA-binding transcriptional regulator/antitoxin component of YhaV-PrlF toxin-antitoxin module
MDCYITVQKRGTIVLPPEIRRRHSLDKPGAQLQVVERADGVIELLPQVPIPAEEAWFWTAAWQAKEKEATADIAAGRVAAFGDADSFLADLDDQG